MFNGKSALQVVLSGVVVTMETLHGNLLPVSQPQEVQPDVVLSAWFGHVTAEVHVERRALVRGRVLPGADRGRVVVHSDHPNLWRHRQLGQHWIEEGG